MTQEELEGLSPGFYLDEDQLLTPVDIGALKAGSASTVARMEHEWQQLVRRRSVADWRRGLGRPHPKSQITEGPPDGTE